MLLIGATGVRIAQAVLVVADLAVGVLSPAPDRAIGQHGVAAQATRDKRRDVGEIEHGDRQRGQAAVVAIAQLAGDVPSPAFRGLIGQQRARVDVAAGDGDRVVDAADLNGHK